MANTALQTQLANQRPRSAKPLNNGIPIFTHERAEERATKQIKVSIIHIKIKTILIKTSV